MTCTDTPQHTKQARERIRHRLYAIIRALENGEYDHEDIEDWLDDNGFPE